MSYPIDIDSKNITIYGSNLERSSLYLPHFSLDIASLTDGLIEEKPTLDTSDDLAANQSAEIQKLQFINNNSEVKALTHIPSFVPHR